MIHRREYESKKKQAAELIEKAGVLVTMKEINSMEVVDFGLNQLE